MCSEAIKLNGIKLITKKFFFLLESSPWNTQRYVTFHRQWGGSVFCVFVQPALIFCQK